VHGSCGSTWATSTSTVHDPCEWRLPNGELAEAREEFRKARQLIERSGYWRRKEELEDPEKVIRGMLPSASEGSRSSPPGRPTLAQRSNAGI